MSRRPGLEPAMPESQALRSTLKSLRAIADTAQAALLASLQDRNALRARVTLLETKVAALEARLPQRG